MGPVDKLDARFRADWAMPDPPEFLGPELLHQQSLNIAHRKFRAIVLLAPGKTLPEFAAPGAVMIVPETFIVALSRADLERLANDRATVYVEGPQLVDLDLQHSVPETKADTNWTAPSNLKGRDVIIGVIDRGLDYTLDDFRDSSGNTRVEYIWDQTLTPQTGENSPTGYSGGVEYDSTAINAALLGGVALRHAAAAGAHGTHVTGIAAGNGTTSDANFPANTFVGVASEAQIIFVEPKVELEKLTSSDYLLEAIKYVFDKADAVGKPAVINISLGHNGGRHDGESLVERAIDRLLESKGRALVKSAGNEAEWQTHAAGKLTQSTPTQPLTWTVGGGRFNPNPSHYDHTANTMEIWYSSRDRFGIRLGDPNGTWTQQVTPGSTLSTMLGPDRIYIESERFHPLNGFARILIRMEPPHSGHLTSGDWTVELAALELVEGQFDAWIERDLRDATNNFADQSFFQNADKERTIGPPGTTRRAVAMANYEYDHSTNTRTIADSSGRGCTGDDRPKPEVAAPGENIYSSNAGANPARVQQSGTSMSAPHVTGIVAQLFGINKDLTAAQIRAVLIASAKIPGNPTLTDFDPQWGYGAVDASAAAQLLR